MTARQREVLSLMNEFEINGCQHCGRCVLVGPPCCQGMREDIAREQEASLALEEAARRERRKVKRARAVARRAERRAAAAKE